MFLELGIIFFGLTGILWMIFASITDHVFLVFGLSMLLSIVICVILARRRDKLIIRLAACTQACVFLAFLFIIAKGRYDGEYWFLTRVLIVAAVDCIYQLILAKISGHLQTHSFVYPRKMSVLDIILAAVLNVVSMSVLCFYTNNPNIETPVIIRYLVVAAILTVADALIDVARIKILDGCIKRGGCTVIYGPGSTVHYAKHEKNDHADKYNMELHQSLIGKK